VILVWNNDDTPDAVTREIASSPEVELLEAESNLGIPGGRNYGLQHCEGDYVVFLDDDAFVQSDQLASRICEYFSTHQNCGALAFRVVDGDDNSQRRHNPRLGTIGLNRAGKVATFAGGACAVRRTSFLDAGGFDASFIYAMEEQDLAWRMYRISSEVHYVPDVRIFHPPSLPSRHPDHLERTWRNRVAAAYKSLPFWIRLIYLTLHGLRTRRMGLRLGEMIRLLIIARTSVVTRLPLKPSTVFQLARIGRPPIF